MTTIFACQKTEEAPQVVETTVIEADDQIFGTSGGTILTTRNASQNRFVDLENASLNSSNVLTDEGITYPFILKGTYDNPSLTTLDRFRGCHSIVYSMPPTTATSSNTTDKSQHRIFRAANRTLCNWG
ncbi:MAG: hypothetical protein HC817_15710 [Saprospiraceae bacterium]|nr:hypothetical protein [Saprospiraceae bacterium]